MNDLTEVRGTNIAFEIRNGVKVEFAAGDRAARMRALGCPETIIKRMREHRSTKRSAGAVQPTENVLALMNGLSPAAYRQRADFERKQRAAAIGRDIARQQDKDLRARAARNGAIIAADAAKDKAENNLRAQMENAAGIVCGRRSKADSYPYEGASATKNPYTDLAASLAKSFPDHSFVGADSKTAFTTHAASKTKWSIPYEQDANGYRFARPALGGHPEWLGVAEKDVS